VRDFLERLGKRYVVRWLIAYLAVSWAGLEFLGFLTDTFAWSVVVPRIGTAVLAAGLPVVLILSWYHGERGRQRVSGPEVALLTVTTLVGLLLIREAARFEPSTLPAGLPAFSQASIAVLPFRNIGDTSDLYYADGLAEEILTRLARLPDLHVIARRSSFLFRDTALDVTDIGRQLGVAHLLEGSVQRAENRVRVRAQLISVADGFEVWSNQYDVEMDDILAVQDSISRAIVDTLQITLGAQAEALLTARPTDDPHAFDLYLRGRYAFYRATPAGLAESLDYYRQAVALDSTYALAYSGMVDSYLITGFNYQAPASLLDDAMRAAENAVRLDPALPAAHVSLGFVRMVEGDLDGSEASFRRALQLDPDNDDAHRWYASLLTYLGRFDAGLGEMAEARRLDPMSLNTMAEAALPLYYARRYRQTVDEVTRVVELNPGSPRVHLWRGWAHTMLGNYERALADYRAEPAVLTGARAHEGHVLALMGRMDEAREIHDELVARADTEWVEPFRIALLHVGMGDHDGAFRWLERAYEARSFHLVTLDVDPMLDPIRDDPRFEDLRRRVGLLH